MLKTSIHGQHFTTSTYEPMLRLNIDFVGPFKDGGYSLTIIDTFTRWVESYVCESADAQKAARCLFEHFGTFESPSQIQNTFTELLNYLSLVGLSKEISKENQKKITKLIIFYKTIGFLSLSHLNPRNVLENVLRKEEYCSATTRIWPKSGFSPNPNSQPCGTA